jgi:uncharacterized protein YndB with AHSA1/START domain
VGRYELTTVVAAPPDLVFDAWTDLDRMHEWVGGVTGVTDRVGAIDEVGARYTVRFGRMSSPTTVIEVERPVRFRTRFGNLILKGESKATFTPEGDGTRIRQVIETRGFVSAVFGRLFATGSYEGSFRGELEKFRRLVESGW